MRAVYSRQKDSTRYINQQVTENIFVSPHIFAVVFKHLLFNVYDMNAPYSRRARLSLLASDNFSLAKTLCNCTNTNESLPYVVFPTNVGLMG